MDLPYNHTQSAATSIHLHNPVPTTIWIWHFKAWNRESIQNNISCIYYKISVTKSTRSLNYHVKNQDIFMQQCGNERFTEENRNPPTPPTRYPIVIKIISTRLRYAQPTTGALKIRAWMFLKKGKPSITVQVLPSGVKLVFTRSKGRKKACFILRVKVMDQAFVAGKISFKGAYCFLILCA